MIVLNGMYNFRDIDGNIVKRTPSSHPYSYEEFVSWMGDYKKGNSKNLYSDRLHQWDSKKFNECCMKVWGNTSQSFGNRKPEEIEKFLSIYLDKSIKLTAITECCNQSNGYPYWSFYYQEIEVV